MPRMRSLKLTQSNEVLFSSLSMGLGAHLMIVSDLVVEVRQFWGGGVWTLELQRKKKSVGAAESQVETTSQNENWTGPSESRHYYERGQIGKWNIIIYYWQAQGGGLPWCDY